jgi:hypothetical protein
MHKAEIYSAMIDPKGLVLESFPNIRKKKEKKSVDVKILFN